jgi:integrase
MSDKTKRALKLILVTAQRPGEVIGIHSSEIDGCWWTIPAERSKNGREHRVFLTPLAINLMEGEKGFVFESPKGEKPIGVNALARALRNNLKPHPKTGKIRMQMEPFTPHDLRRTAATRLAEMGYTDEIIGAILNHTRPTVTAHHYNHYRYDKEKRTALENWARKLESIITGEQIDNVIPIN